VSSSVAAQPAFRVTPTTVTVLAFAAIAWAATIARAHALGNGAGTMGMHLAPFLAMWALMMTAMMLPAVAPVASLYALTIQDARARRVPLFVGGYVVVWAAFGLPAYAALRLVDHEAGGSATALRTIAVAVLIAAGVFQLTPLKTRCLRHCRSPLGLLLRFGDAKGSGRDLRFAFHHAGFCLGCCWALMALFVVFGVMSVGAMLGVTAVVVAEKIAPGGAGFGRAVGVACLVLAACVAVSPSVARNVLPTPHHEMQMTTSGT
jgi:predicted metal-binding membrane protein